MRVLGRRGRSGKRQPEDRVGLQAEVRGEGGVGL